MTVAASRTSRERELSRSDHITRTEELLSQRPYAADRKAVDDELIRLNMVVAREVARRYTGRGLAADDLEQVAYVGLVKAVKGFDAEKGSEFLSFAVPTIRGELQRWFRDAGWTVRPPRSVQELQAQITRAQDDLVHRLGRPATAQEIADALDEEIEAVLRAMAASGCFIASSLDAPTAGDGEEGTEWASRLGEADPGYAHVEARVALRPLLRDLDERELTMLRMRFVDGATQTQIGTTLGVTQTQVSRRMSALLARLRTQLDGSAQPAPA